MWKTGNWQGAIEAYFKLERYITRGMADGRDLHEEWETHVRDTKTLPIVFGGAKLNNPIPEKKYEIPMYDWMTLVFKPDCVDSPDLHEFKSGTGSATEYAESLQLPVYAVGLTMADIYVKQGHVHLYNQHSKRSEYASVWITDSLLKKGLNFIQTVGGEMHEYFTKNGLYERFGKKDLPIS